MRKGNKLVSNRRILVWYGNRGLTLAHIAKTFLKLYVTYIRAHLQVGNEEKFFEGQIHYTIYPKYKGFSESFASPLSHSGFVRAHLVTSRYGFHS